MGIPKMAKAKSKAIIMAADGAGGMAQVQDRRFEKDDWPTRFEVPKDQADTWLQYLSAECGRRGWSSGGITQLAAEENSGSLTINTGGPGQPQLAVVWERKRGGSLKVRARSAGVPEFPLDQANDLFRQINESSGACATERFHRGWQLSYDGLPWRGELWLDDTLRLGPPSQQDETALLGPRIILVHELINGIDLQHASASYMVMLRELSVFLSVVMGTNVRVSPNGGRGWTWSTNSSGQVECEIGNIGYWEKQWPKEMPARGQIQSVPIRAVSRPDFSLRGIDGTQTELHLPGDILDLWRTFTGLPPDRRQQFLQVGSMWQLALSLDHDYQTARFAWMVVACEVLKPPDPQFRDHNIYHVVEALLGKPVANQLQEQWFRPQNIRNVHLHRGEFRGSEFVQHAMMSSFQDPTFDHACSVLYQIVQAAIIEWLRQRGTFTLLPLKRRRSWRRWVKDHALSVLPVLGGLGIAVGIVLGWLLHGAR
jgi:hypothetical protein